MATVFFCLLLLATCRSGYSQDTLYISFNLAENTPPGVLIGNVANSSNVWDIINETSQDSSVTFVFPDTISSSSEVTYFQLNSTSGDLRTSGTEVDRESLCPFAVRCTLKLTIHAKGGVHFKIISTTVDISDVNDNSPTFQQDHIRLSIPESASVGYEFLLGRAEDPDMGVNNSIMSYQLLQNDGTFDVVMEPEKFGSFLFKLRVNSSLDRESREVYSLQVVARDGGEPVRSGILNIDIQITDINDNPPNFLSDLYNVTVEKDVSVGTVIMTLTAEDRDAGENGRVGYEISQRQPNVNKIRELFAVDADTGNLSVIKDLQYESATSYSFFIDAYDHGVSPLSIQATVTVNVKNVGNNAPVLKLNLRPDTRVVNVSENVQVETFVLHFTAEDNDLGLNGDVSCSVSNSLFAVRSLGGNNYKVIVYGELDRERAALHNVTVTCSDAGSPNLNASEQFQVRVTDKNDNAPKFDRDIYSVAVEENKVSVIIFQVAATDLDADANGNFEYVLGSDGFGKVSINNNTGVVYTAAPFDREEQDLVVFTVLAVDKGSPPKTGTATVSVTVTDVNDNTPVLLPPTSDLAVLENMTANMFVGLLEAVDGDIGQNGNFTFSIAPSSASYPFILYPNGRLETTAVLDRELKSQYELPVLVRDQGVEPLSSTQYVTIYVLDVNDNAPIVTFPNAVNDTAKFRYPDSTYNVVTMVAAYDLDSGENQTLSYSIIGGNDAGMFAIDKDIGEITVERFLEITSDVTVTLQLEISDRGKRPQSTRVYLNIQLLYANDTQGREDFDNVGNKYVVISIVVVVATVLLAVVIVGVIVFLRTLDRRKHGDAETCTSCTDTGLSPSGRCGPHALSADRSSTSSSEDSKDGGKKKKEVTFILDYKLGGTDGGRQQESTTDGNSDSNQHRFYDTAPVSPRQVPLTTSRDQDKLDSHMKSLKIQQFLWEAKAREWEKENIQVIQSPVGDSESETSRETITCDSGRGGSEDDVSTTSPTADDRGNVFMDPRQSGGKHVTFSPPPYSSLDPRDTPTKRQCAPVHPGIPPPRPPPYRNNKSDFRTAVGRGNYNSKNVTVPNQNSSHNSNLLTVPRTDRWGSRDNNKTFPTGYTGNFGHTRHDSMTSLRSDDGGSTTTSGSYTLDQDDFDLDCFPSQRDVVV